MLSQSSFEAVLEQLHDGVYVLDRDRKILFWNKAAECLSGFPRKEVIGKRCADNILVHVDAQGNSLCGDGCPMLATMQDERPREAIVYMQHREGHRIPVSVRATALHDDKGKVIGAIEVFTDATEDVETLDRVKELERQAMLDVLTGLPNRRFLESVLDSRMDSLSRYDWGFGLVMIDIDDFKVVNDQFGHATGDLALRLVGRTLRSSARRSDTVGRWGGDEFLGIAPCANLATLEALAHRLRALVGASLVRVGGEQLRVTVSVGVTMAQPGENSDVALRRADERLYAAKKAGRNRVVGE